MTEKQRRDPLAKQGFLGGNRQKWAIALLLCAAGVLYVDATTTDFNPEPYLTFLTMIGCVFLTTLGVDSYVKIRKAEPQHQPSPSTYEPSPPDYGP
jgi:hypothetical protein